MTIFLLTPTEVESDQWNGSNYKGEAIARAENQDQARRLAHSRFWETRESRLTKESPNQTWLSPELMTCETIDDWDGEMDGKVEILYPVEYAAVDPGQEAEYLRALAYQAEHQTTNLRKLGEIIHNHLRGTKEIAIAISKVTNGVASITNWANEVKETGEPDLLPKIAPGLRKIADELDRQAMQPN